MLGGDEVGALVVDIGSHTTRAGHAGEDSPKAVLPSVVCEHKAASSSSSSSSSLLTTSSSPGALGARREGAEAVAVCAEGAGGCVARWDAAERVVQHALSAALCGPYASEHPLLATEPPTPPQRPQRTQLAELCFERLHVPALFVAAASALAAFAAGRSTALVVDVGASAATVCAVHEGYCLRRTACAVASHLGGDRLTAGVLRALTDAGTEVLPRYAVRRREVSPGEWRVLREPETACTASYRAHCVAEVADDVKRALCRVAPSHAAAAIATTASDEQQQQYELPGGALADLGTARTLIPELLFAPESHALGGPALRSLQDTVADVLLRCDVDVRPALLQSVVVTGGGSLLPGFTERFATELRAAVPAFKGRLVVPPSADERRFGAWIGGSILASLGTFHQLWVSRAEYEECGAAILDKKCP